MATLKLSNNQALNPLTVDLSAYMKVEDGGGMDVANPTFSQRVFSRSLLKEGATLALTQYVEKELLFPLLLGPVGGVAGAPQSMSAVASLIGEINQILETPGATCSWQPDGVSQPTVFDVLVGQFEVAYSFRKEEAHWTEGNLRVFAQPFGRTAAPRAYAAASGVGPLLMISPYASSGAQAIGASTQAGVAGFGGQQQGASSGVFYWGSPSLAGDAPALLQVSYVGPLPNTATNTGVVPTVAVSLLPDPLYSPLITAPEITFANLNSSTSRRSAQTSVASSYLQLATGGSLSVVDMYSFSPLQAPSAVGLEPTALWAGSHRLLAIARASAGNPAGGLAGTLALQPGPLVSPGAQQVSVPGQFDWDLYDLGTFQLRPSEYPEASVQVKASLTAGGSAALDVGALVMLPDNATWFLNPALIQPSQYGYPTNLASAWAAPNGAWTNTLLLNDTVADQFLYSGPSQTFAPSPIGAVPSSARVTPFSRGLVPRPEPQNGLPIVAVVGVGQPQDPALQFSSSLTSSSFGPNGPAVGSDNSAIGTVAWTNPGNVTANDGNYATAAGSNAVSHDLEATGFGFNVPSGATIQGIQVNILRVPFGQVFDNDINLVTAGSGFSKGGGTLWPNAVVNQAYGGPTDLWGGTWTPSIVNASTFGAALAVQLSSSATALVDYITITIYFTTGSTNQFRGASQANPQNIRTMAQVSVVERTRYVLP